MDINSKHIKTLLDKALAQQLSSADVRQLLELADEEQYHEALMAAMENQFAAFASGNTDDVTYWQDRKDSFFEHLNTIRQEKMKAMVAPSDRSFSVAEEGTDMDLPIVPRAHRIHFPRRGWLKYAAAVILVFGAAAYFWTITQKMEQPLANRNHYLPTDIAPGRDRAILTLANGQQIILDSTQGNIVKQGRLTVVNLAGKLKYEGTGTTTEYNTISTPKGGQYQIVLPDGSKVWLNAASSIKFPTAFESKDRQVEMTGEAYMEIAKNAKQSFTVKANGVEIQVLGTSFNVNAYLDEPAVKTTLLTGKVKIGTTILKPGEANVDGKVVKTNVEQDVAWKEGLFNFDDMDVKAMIRQLSRWYDVEPVFESNIPNRKFGGEMSRSLNLSQVLKLLQKMEVHVRVEGKKLIVTK